MQDVRTIVRGFACSSWLGLRDGGMGERWGISGRFLYLSCCGSSRKAVFEGIDGGQWLGGEHALTLRRQAAGSLATTLPSPIRESSFDTPGNFTITQSSNTSRLGVLLLRLPCLSEEHTRRLSFADESAHTLCQVTYYCGSPVSFIWSGKHSDSFLVFCFSIWSIV